MDNETIGKRLESFYSEEFDYEKKLNTAEKLFAEALKSIEWEE